MKRVLGRVGRDRPRRRNMAGTISRSPGMKEFILCFRNFIGIQHINERQKGQLTEGRRVRRKIL